VDCEGAYIEVNKSRLCNVFWILQMGIWKSLWCFYYVVQCLKSSPKLHDEMRRLKNEKKLSYTKRVTNIVFVKSSQQTNSLFWTILFRLNEKTMVLRRDGAGTGWHKAGLGPTSSLPDQRYISKRFMQTVTKELSSVLVNKYTDLRSSQQHKSVA
jgi:hypothetical protein